MIVNVVDVNDNYLECFLILLVFVVLELVVFGDVVVIFNCSDLDSGGNGKLFYIILVGNLDGEIMSIE